jgi:hypothetical protein
MQLWCAEPSLLAIAQAQAQAQAQAHAVWPPKRSANSAPPSPIVAAEAALAMSAEIGGGGYREEEGAPSLIEAVLLLLWQLKVVLVGLQPSRFRCNIGGSWGAGTHNKHIQNKSPEHHSERDAMEQSRAQNGLEPPIYDGASVAGHPLQLLAALPRHARTWLWFAGFTLQSPRGFRRAPARAKPKPRDAGRRCVLQGPPGTMGIGDPRPFSPPGGSPKSQRGKRGYLSEFDHLGLPGGGGGAGTWPFYQTTGTGAVWVE